MTSQPIEAETLSDTRMFVREGRSEESDRLHDDGFLHRAGIE